MTSATDLRNLSKAARPTVEKWLDIGEEFAAFRDAATEKGIDWSQLKALLKAQVQDERDGKDRVAKLLEKADHAAGYADMLGLGETNNFSSRPEPASNPPPTPIPPSVPAQAMSAPAEDNLDYPEFLDRRRQVPA